MTRNTRKKPEDRSKRKLEQLLRAKHGPSMEPPRTHIPDPIEMACRNHPGLTAEEAAQLLEDMGY